MLCHAEVLTMPVAPCSHLDRDGDGYISVAEVAVLLEELGIDADEHQRQASGPEMGQLPGGRAGQKLLGALANKEPNKVSFEEFLHFNSQVWSCLLYAVRFPS